MTKIQNYKQAFRISNLEFGIYCGDFIGLLSSFLIATSYWHINFSRIGFRAILVPFLSAFGMYFLLKGFHRGKILDFVWAGIFIGLGFHTYIAFRLMPLVILAPLLWYGARWFWEARNSKFEIRNNVQNSNATKYCTPCVIALFLLVTFVTALPLD